MKCYRHPREDALYECSMCGKPICGDCMTFADETDHITCPVCNMSTARDAALHSAEDELADYEHELTERRGRITWRERLNIEVNSGILFLVIGLLFANLWISSQLSTAQTMVGFADDRLFENNSPAPQFSLLLSQILRYQEQHGKPPQKLVDLEPALIDAPPKVMKTGEDYSYSLDPKIGFVLSISRAERLHFVKLYATADGELHIE